MVKMNCSRVKIIFLNRYKPVGTMYSDGYRKVRNIKILVIIQCDQNA